MKLKLDPRDFRFDGSEELRIKKARTKVPDLYRDDADYELLIRQFHRVIRDTVAAHEAGEEANS